MDLKNLRNSNENYETSKTYKETKKLIDTLYRIVMDELRNKTYINQEPSITQDSKKKTINSQEMNLSVENNSSNNFKNLVLDGEWDKAEDFIYSLQEKAKVFSVNRMLYEINKQRLLESASKDVN